MNVKQLIKILSAQDPKAQGAIAVQSFENCAVLKIEKIYRTIPPSGIKPEVVVLWSPSYGEISEVKNYKKIVPCVEMLKANGEPE